eukprot:881905-Rhodomonas_salina.3
MGGADSCGNFDFSYNGLGDREASVFARVLTTHFKSKHASAVVRSRRERGIVDEWVQRSCIEGRTEGDGQEGA